MSEFEFEFVNECKRLGLRKCDVAQTLNVSQPTLSKRLKDPEQFNAVDLVRLDELGFRMNGIRSEINRRLATLKKLAQ